MIHPSASSGVATSWEGGLIQVLLLELRPRRKEASSKCCFWSCDLGGARPHPSAASGVATSGEGGLIQVLLVEYLPRVRVARTIARHFGLVYFLPTLISSYSLFSFYLLPLFLCFILFLLFPYACVGTTLLQEFAIFNGLTE